MKKKKVTLEDLQKEIKELRKEVEKHQTVIIIPQAPVVPIQQPYTQPYSPYIPWMGPTICGSWGGNSVTTVSSSIPNQYFTP